MKFAAAFSLFLTLSVASHAQAQERQWSLDASNNQAFLSFGVPESDDVGLSLWCDVGKTKISALMPDSVAKLHQGEILTVQVDVDGHAERVIGLVSRDGASGKLVVVTYFGLKGSVMQALRHGQTLALSVKGHVTRFPIADADFDGLVDACNGIDPAG